MTTFPQSYLPSLIDDLSMAPTLEQLEAARHRSIPDDEDDWSKNFNVIFITFGELYTSFELL